MMEQPEKDFVHRLLAWLDEGDGQPSRP